MSMRMNESRSVAWTKHGSGSPLHLEAFSFQLFRDFSRRREIKLHDTLPSATRP